MVVDMVAAWVEDTGEDKVVDTHLVLVDTGVVQGDTLEGMVRQREVAGL